MNLSVPEEWILAGATLEIELPRNLACAACGGGGCDVCERSGAVSLRGRSDPVETLEVTLEPSTVSDDVPSSRTRRLVVRIPEHGGHARPVEGSEIPRGHLLLSVRSGPPPPRGVKRLSGPSIRPVPEATESSTTRVPSAAPVAPERPRSPWALLLLAGIALAAIAWWLLRG
jgi:hypothetical protein